MKLGNKKKFKRLTQTTIIGLALVLALTGAGCQKDTNTNKDPNVNAASNANTNKVTNTNASSDTDPYADLMKYDNKVIDITSTDGKVKGQVGIKIDKTEAYPINVVYFLKVNDSLPKSVAEVTGAGETYYYIANHAAAANIQKGNGTGSLSAAFCNTDSTPDILALAESRDIDLDLYLGCDAQYDPWHSTSTFTHIYGNYYNSDTFNYDLVTAKDALAVFDTAQFYAEDPETGGFGADDATVIGQGSISAQYDLTFTE